MPSTPAPLINTSPTMTKPHPASLGDVYPALRNFLKLTALALEVPQLALTVQAGSRPYSTGALSYGPITQVVLRQMLEQPQPDLTPITEVLSLGTLYRNNIETSTEKPPVESLVLGPSVALVGRLHPPQTSYYLTFYIPGVGAESLSQSQVKTLSYLSQQLTLSLRTVALPPTLVPPPLSPSLDALENTNQPAQDFLSRVVSINPPRPVGASELKTHLPSMVDLVAQLQACLSYKQLGDVLEEYLPLYFPQQSGQVVLLSGYPAQLLTLTIWGQGSRLQTFTQRCLLVDQRPPAPRPGSCTRCHLSPAHPLAADAHDDLSPGSTITCTVLGHFNQTTCLLQMVQPAEGLSPMQTVLLQKLSEHIIYVMQRLLALEDLQTQATHDALTGLLNRRPMESVLRNLCQTGNQQQPVSLILIDIDHFQTINDTFGHQVGDQVLKDLSFVLRGHVRSQDVVCRYGGEKFCMVLFDTPLDVAMMRAEKIRRAVKYLTLTHNDQPIEPLTISLGVSCFPIHGQDPEQLLDQADQALHWAKTHGRDGTASADQMLMKP